MKLIEKLANDGVDPMEKHCCAHCWQSGFRGAREMAAALLDDALKWACIEVDSQDRETLQHQVTRIRAIGESEVQP